mmetsp:Transcript_6259/g.20992  ORF Transcript_6259/g.20992 Transcript_6259/m.20992 type:complete len:266 (-) Transcript_6259:211-1008(-)
MFCHDWGWARAERPDLGRAGGTGPCGTGVPWIVASSAVGVESFINGSSLSFRRTGGSAASTEGAGGSGVPRAVVPNRRLAPRNPSALRFAPPPRMWLWWSPASSPPASSTSAVAAEADSERASRRARVLLSDVGSQPSRSVAGKTGSPVVVEASPRFDRRDFARSRNSLSELSSWSSSPSSSSSSLSPSSPASSSSATTAASPGSSLVPSSSSRTSIAAPSGPNPLAPLRCGLGASAPPACTRMLVDVGTAAVPAERSFSALSLR